MKNELKQELKTELARIKEIEEATYLFDGSNNIYVNNIQSYVKTKKAELGARLLKEVLLTEDEIKKLLKEAK